MKKYDIIFESLQEKVNSGELNLEDAEVINDIAYNKYVIEDGHSKKLKARHNAQKKHIEQRFYDNMNYKHIYTDSDGTKHGTVQRGDGPEVDVSIPKKGLAAHESKMNGNITIGRNVTRMKGSDLTGSHEYSHSLDYHKIKDNVQKHKDDYNTKTDLLYDAVDNGDKNMIKKTKKDVTKSKDRYIKKFDKATVKNNGEFNDYANEVKKKFRLKNDHDRSGHELKADNYAITTTSGENNINRDRKHLNELGRRQISATFNPLKNTMKKSNTRVDKMDDKTIKQKLKKTH